MSNTIRPKYKKVILDIIEVDQLISYLALAKDSIANHALKDLQDFRTKINKQLRAQDLKLKKDC